MPQTAPLWTALELARACGAQTTAMWTASALTFDSRDVKAGTVFIALKAADFPTLGGGTSDGHKYIADAFDKGAAGVIAEHVPEQFANDPRVILVPSTYQALIDIATIARARCGGHIIGVTGSVGKTSTRDMLSLTFGTYGQVHQSTKNYNNMMGLPYTLANMAPSTDYGIIEMGMSNPGEIIPLTKIARPHIAIITIVAPAHAANFKNGIDGIADAKSEIFAGLEPGGIAIINRDMDTYARVLGNARTTGVANILTFGEHPEADARMIQCVEARNGTRVTALIEEIEVEFFIPAGRHQAMNALAVLLAVKRSGLDVQKAAARLATFAPVEGRGREEHLNIGDPENPLILIDESYNASPAAMNAAFRVVALIDPGRGGRRIAILGDMLELGDQGPKLHADLALPLRAANIDLVYTCGMLMKNLHDSLPANNRGLHRDTSSELAQIVPDVLVPGDVVVVKGSHGSRMDLVVEALRTLPARKGVKTPVGEGPQNQDKDKTGQNRHAL